MSSQWADVDTLIHELGALRAASFATGGQEPIKAAIDKALEEATSAVLLTFDAPQDRRVIASAHEAIESAAKVIATLDEELVRPSARVTAAPS
jgi:hypothetical protein